MASADSGLSSGPSDDLGRVLTRLRNERGLSQKQLANLAAINNSTLSRLESGERGVSREVLDRICAVLALDRHEELDLLTAAGFLNQDAAQAIGGTPQQFAQFIAAEQKRWKVVVERAKIKPE